jgi:hypothetical protein
MAIFNINLELEKEYIDLIKDIYKITMILVVFQIILYYSNCQKNILNSALTGTLLNDDFMTLLIYLILSMTSYYLVFDKLVSFN